MTARPQDWYVNFGEFPNGRSWVDARELGFVSAGWEPTFSDPLRRVPAGARIWVYRAPMAGHPGIAARPGGYIGRGLVTGPAVPASEAVVTRFGRPRLLRELQDEHELAGNYFGWTSLEDAEYVLPVVWERTTSPQHPLRRAGLFSNQTTAVLFDRTKPRHAETLAFLESNLSTGEPIDG